MKQLIFTLTLLLVFTGCISTGVKFSPNNPNEFRASRWNGGSIQIFGEKLSEFEYHITAKGAGFCSEEQILKEWMFVADQLANRRPFSAHTETNSYSYSSGNGMMVFNHNALMITGTIVVSDDLSDEIMGD